jgi:hypothetical protein
MHHKRRKPKSSRAGCLFCKSHKHQAEKHHARAREKREGACQIEQWRHAREGEGMKE